MFGWYFDGIVPLMSIIELKVKEKGRTVLPVELQKACGFKPGDTLIVEEISVGKFLVETKESKIQRLWDLAKSTNLEIETEDLLHARSNEEEAHMEKLVNSNAPTDEESERRAAALLATVLGQ